MRGVRSFVTIFVVLPNVLKGVTSTVIEEDMKLIASEMAMGEPSDLMGTNPHYAQPEYYNDFSRRFVAQYPYIEVPDAKLAEDEEGDIVPQRASPELVLNIARQSALLARPEPENPADDIIRNQILRSGEYWNGVWKENVDQKQILRSPNFDQSLTTLKVKIMPDNEYYDLISRLQKISPRLIYIINKKNFN